MHTIGRNEYHKITQLQARVHKVRSAIGVLDYTRHRLAQVLDIRVDELPETLATALDDATAQLQTELMFLDDDLSAARENLRNALDTRND